MFQLKHQLTRLKISQPEVSDSLNNLDDEHEVDANGICNGKEEGEWKLCAKFGQSRTYCDLLCIASCGVILGHAICYGSEAPNAVHVCEYLTS